MTDLTEKWKAGELEDGFYYTQTGKDKIIDIDMYDKGSDSWLLNSDKDMPPFEVLAPVPSYNEFKSINDKIKLLRSALRYSNSTAKLSLNVFQKSVRFCNQEKIINELETMINKTKWLYSNESK